MKLSNILIVVIIIAMATGCDGGGGSSSAPPARTLVALSLSPANASLARGTMQQFTATGTYSDNSTQDLTTSVNWASSVSAVISNVTGFKGLATAITAGTTTIAAASGGISGAATLTVTDAGVASNEILVTVNGALCSGSPYLNKPCVAVTICNPGTSTCQAIDDIILDTGSQGLRIFKQALTVLPPATGSLAECSQFGDGSSMWGPVQTADVILGGEPVVRVPIQVIDSAFGVRPAGCANADPTPAVAGFKGILGVGLFTHDCGAACVSTANNGIYFACGAGCTRTAVPLSNQVQNPAALLPRDNNGVLVQLPSVPLGGTVSVNGKLILGIGTQPNNAPTPVTTYAADATTGEFTTLFNGRTYTSYLDSGSNGLFFTPPPASQLLVCAAPDTRWFCPVSMMSFSATNTSASGTPSGTVPFQIGNFSDLTINSSSRVFTEIGGTFPGDFDWGLPFLFGRNVFVGYQGSTSSLGSGPYWAY